MMSLEVCFSQERQYDDIGKEKNQNGNVHT